MMSKQLHEVSKQIVLNTNYRKTKSMSVNLSRSQNYCQKGKLREAIERLMHGITLLDSITNEIWEEEQELKRG